MPALSPACMLLCCTCGEPSPRSVADNALGRPGLTTGAAAVHEPLAATQEQAAALP